MRWREVGTSSWTNGPTIKVRGEVKNRPGSQTATGLSPHTRYEYQLCGKEFSDQFVACVGPNGKTNTTEKFVTPGGSAAGNVPKQRGGNQSPGKKGPRAASPTEAQTTAPGAQANAPETETTASGPASSASNASNSDGREEWTSALTAIAIGLGLAALVLGGSWSVSRWFEWKRWRA